MKTPEDPETRLDIPRSTLGGRLPGEPYVIRKAGKERMHPRNRFRAGYDFGQLARDNPALAAFVRPNAYGSQSIDYADADAVKALNRALLKHAYGLEAWDIPAGFLCPPIPGRSDYLHYLADLLAESKGGKVPRGPTVAGSASARTHTYRAPRAVAGRPSSAPRSLALFCSSVASSPA